MDDFKLDCTTVIQTHDLELAKLLRSHADNKTESSFGWVVSYHTITAELITKWVFRLIKWQESEQ